MSTRAYNGGLFMKKAEFVNIQPSEDLLCQKISEKKNH